MKRILAAFFRAFVLKFRSFDFSASEFQMRPGLILRKGHLYKYKSLAGTDHLSHVIEIVRDSKLYFPRPSQLNDPDEGKPQMFIGDIADHVYWPKVEDWVRRCVSHRSATPTETQIKTELEQLTQAKLNAMVREADIAFKDAVEQLQPQSATIKRLFVDRANHVGATSDRRPSTIEKYCLQ